MAYTQKLIDEVKELYPDNDDMIKHAESGSVWLGRYLCDSIEDGIPIKDILKATSLDELQATARIIKRRNDLYSKWCKQDPRQNNS